METVMVDKNLLFDTDVIIDALRGYGSATGFLQSQKCRMTLSVLTLAELYSGIRNEKEKTALSDFSKAFELIPLNENIAIHAGELFRIYSKSHGIGLADAVIAATAIKINAELVTLNKKHFPMLENVLIPYTKH